MTTEPDPKTPAPEELRLTPEECLAIIEAYKAQMDDYFGGSTMETMLMDAVATKTLGILQPVLAQLVAAIQEYRVYGPRDDAVVSRLNTALAAAAPYLPPEPRENHG